VIEGDAATEIIAAANSGNYDAVVMSTLGAGAFRRWFIIGSVTAKVLHASEHPVITSAHFEKHRSPKSIDRILCAIDLGPQSSRVLCWAWQAAQRFEANLTIAHAAPSIEDGTMVADDKSWKETASSRLRERINELKQGLRVQAATRVEFDHPAHAISELARETNADLVVLGRGASQGLIGRLRANAYDIIRQCGCPVVSV
jgi:nucleotide-binding universal stress UspA family protein